MWFFGGHRCPSEERLNDYVSGRLSAADRVRLEQAVQHCARCREELESLQQTRALLQTIPQEPLPRSFLFAEAPVPATTDVDRPAQATGFRMPVWAYAGAAAVAGVAVIAFFLSGAVGVWLPQGGEDEAGSLSSVSPLEMAEAESAPFSPVVPDSILEAQPAQAMAKAMAVTPSSPATVTAQLEESEVTPETGGEVQGETERIMEAETAPAPVAEAFAEVAEPANPSEMAAEPQVAAMADMPPPVASAAAQPEMAGESESKAVPEMEATVSQAMPGQAEVGAPAPSGRGEVDEAREVPDGMETPEAVQESGPEPTATGIPAKSREADRAAAPEPAVEERVTLAETQPTEPASTAVSPPIAPAATVADDSRATVVPEPAGLNGMGMQPGLDETGADKVEGAVEPTTPAGPIGPAGPTGAASQIPPADVGPESETSTQSAGAGGWSVNLSATELVLAAIFAVVAAAVVVVVAMMLARRNRSDDRVGG